jgi:acetylornithine/succinyldiaminopimelate/putrescine aminotransferase
MDCVRVFFCNSGAEAADPVGRVVNAIRIFGKLVKPEKMTWIFDYRIVLSRWT